MAINPQTRCGTCGDPLNMTACAGCARRDYDGMRDFQAKFIKCDHERRALLTQVEGLRKALDGAVTWLQYTPEGRSIHQVGGQPGDWLRSALAALDVATEKKQCVRPIEEVIAELAAQVPPEAWAKVKPKIEELLGRSAKRIDEKAPCSVCGRPTGGCCTVEGRHPDKRVEAGPKKEECCCQPAGPGLKEFCPGCPVHAENPQHEDDVAKRKEGP